VVARLVGAGARIVAVTSQTRTLEDVYADAIAGAGADAGADAEASAHASSAVSISQQSEGRA
jgi:hypothetical protein